MAATTANALKALIESAGIGLRAYRDVAPEDEDLPYVTIREELVLVRDGRDGAMDRDVAHVGTETVQVDLWQRWLDPDTYKSAESHTLVRALQHALDGVPLSDHPTHGWLVRFVSSVRLLERDTNLVHHALTVEVVRDL
jgi:hypothetical protein